MLVQMDLHFSLRLVVALVVVTIMEVIIVEVIEAEEDEQKVVAILLLSFWGRRTCSEELLETAW